MVVGLAEAWEGLMGSMPKVAGAVIVLIVGWAAGRLIGKAVSALIERSGLDRLLKKTVIGRAIIRRGISPVRFFDLLIRWFIYLVAIFAVIDILQIQILSSFMKGVVEYLPNLIAGIAILIFGFIIADFLGDAVSAIGMDAKIPFHRIIGSGVKFLLYFIVITVALTQMKIEVQILYIFATALAWGTAVGIAVGLGISLGWGLKDYITKNTKKLIPTIEEAAKCYEERLKKETKKK